jgi:hypothetical protein
MCSEQHGKAHAAGERAFAGGYAARVQLARSKTRQRTLFVRVIASHACQSPTLHVAIKKHEVVAHEELHEKAHLRARSGRAG